MSILITNTATGATYTPAEVDGWTLHEVDAISIWGHGPAYRHASGALVRLPPPAAPRFASEGSSPRGTGQVEMRAESLPLIVFETRGSDDADLRHATARLTAHREGKAGGASV